MCDNIKENNPIGHSLQLPKTQNTTRIHLQNLRGISLGNSGSWETTCAHWQDMQVDIALSCETNIDTTKYKTIHLLHQGANRILGKNSYRIATSSSTVSSPTYYKPGGVLAMTLGNISGQVLTTHNDLLGRWTSITLRCTDQTNPIVIIVTYQVCAGKHPKLMGPITLATQLYSMYISQERPNPEKIKKAPCK